MALDRMKKSISTKDLEHWLTQVFIPVEPSELFIRRLKARLLKYRGKHVFSVWMIIGVVAMTLMIMLTWLGFILRIFLILTGLFSDRRQSSGGEKPLTVIGS